MKLKSIIFLSAIMGLTLMIASCGGSSDFKYQKYTSKLQGLDIVADCIAGWMPYETRGVKGDIASVAFAENIKTKTRRAVISITVEPVTQEGPGTADAKAKDLINRKLFSKNASVLVKSKIKAMGSEGAEVLFSDQALDRLYGLDAKLVPVKEKMVVLKSGNKFYTLRYENTAERFEIYAGAFSHIVRSLKTKSNP